MSKFAVAALCAAFPLALACSQTLAVPDALPDAVVEAVTTDASAACCRLEAGHLIDLEIVDPLNSWEFKRGDGFQLKVAEPVRVEGHELIPAGTPVRGEIVHAAAARGGGAPGELLIAARALELDGLTVRLRGLKLGRSGDDNSGMAIGVAIAAGPFAMFIRGTEIEIPPGTRVQARLAEALDLAPPVVAVEPSTRINPELP